MKVGVPREVKENEFRVALTPAGALALGDAGHPVFVEAGAGQGSGFADQEYAASGATLCKDPAELYGAAELILKVKEPQPSELSLLRPDQLLFGYLHLAASRELAEGLLASRVTALAFETLRSSDGALPLLAPMSAIAGRLAAQAGARFLERPVGGSGVLLSGAPGVLPGRVLVLGAGIVGENAAIACAGLGADVILADVNLAKLREVSVRVPSTVRTVLSTPELLQQLLPTTDLLVGAVLVGGRRAPILLRREHFRLMKHGSVFVDVCIDQGGCAETSRPTSHAQPTYVEEGIIHYCVANMPGAVPRTSTFALAAVTLPYVLQLAQRGLQGFSSAAAGQAEALNVQDGKLVHPDVQLAFPDLPASKSASEP